jgi:membrane-bound serine protease (ClpP class)
MTWLLIAALLAIGMVLLFAEVAIIPGFGIAGISAIVFILAGGATAWVRYGPVWGMGSLILAGGLAIGIIVIAPRTRAGKGLVLRTAITSQHSGDSDYASLEGKAGVALTPLRPAGAADIGGRRVDVVTDGQFIDSGRKIKVVMVEGARVVVALSDSV